MPTSHYIDTHWSVDEIRIYPNPSRDWVTIDFFSIEMGKVFITVTDASGRLMNRIVFDYYGTGRREMLNVSRYASGNYFIRIQKGIYPLTNSIQKDGTYSIQVLR